MTKQAPSARRDAARGTAIQALAYLAENMERLEPFMAITGLEPRGLRAAAADLGFLAGVLEYLTSNEKLLVDFAGSAGINPAEIVHAREALSGPPPDWGP